MAPENLSTAIGRFPMKASVRDLAIFGGAKAFTNPRLVGRPAIGDQNRLKERFVEVVNSRRFTNDGPCVREFEEQIASLAGVKHCIATCNATIALEILARASGLHGEVIVPSFTFIATAHAFEWLGIKPVFADIDPSSHTLDPDSVARAITPATSAIIGVHTWGRPCDAEGLERVARQHGVGLFFDAAHALACSHRGRMIGQFGRAEVFSFHATKFVNSFEGGAIVTNDDELAERLAIMRSFGFDDYDHVESIGTNGKMHEVSAIMGLNSLEAMNERIAVNRRNYELYASLVRGIPGLSIFSYDTGERCNFQYVVVEVSSGPETLSRDAIQEILWAERVETRRYFYPGCHRSVPYSQRPADQIPVLPNTDLIAGRVLVLPTGPSISPDDVRTICRILAFIQEHAGEILELRKRHPIDRARLMSAL